MDVKVKKISGCVLVFLACATLGVSAIAQWILQRSWPRKVDDEGLETRGGKRIAWNEFTKSVRVFTHVSRTSSAGTVHFELFSPKGRVIVAPYRLEDGDAVLNYIWQRLPETAKTKTA